MKILIKWNEKQYLAEVKDDYKVSIMDMSNESSNCFIDLDQCRECGVWKSEDEELYGDGYCENCGAICIHCEKYYPHKDMAKVDGDGCCKQCLKEL